MASNIPDTTTSAMEASTSEGTGNGDAAGRTAPSGRNTGAIPRPNNPCYGRSHLVREGTNQPGGSPHQGRNANIPLLETVACISRPTYYLQPLNTAERRFSARSRLFIANIPPELADVELHRLFKMYGEIGEFFIHRERKFGFVRMDYHANAMKARKELHGVLVKGKMLKVYFSKNGGGIKVKNLPPFVTNELLHRAFSIFGKIERCLITVDVHGKSKGEGIVEFARKYSAIAAIRKCGESCYFLTASLRPAIVEPYNIIDDSEGLPEKNLYKGNPEYLYARRVGPRFATTGSFQDAYGILWKQLHDVYRQKEEALQKEMEAEMLQLQSQMDVARAENETEIIREQLRIREQQLTPASGERQLAQRLQQCTMQRERTVANAASSTNAVSSTSAATSTTADVATLTVQRVLRDGRERNQSAGNARGRGAGCAKTRNFHRE